MQLDLGWPDITSKSLVRRGTANTARWESLDPTWPGGARSDLLFELGVPHRQTTPTTREGAPSSIHWVTDTEALPSVVHAAGQA